MGGILRADGGVVNGSEEDGFVALRVMIQSIYFETGYAGLSLTHGISQTLALGVR